MHFAFAVPMNRCGICYDVAYLCDLIFTNRMVPVSMSGFCSRSHRGSPLVHLSSWKFFIKPIENHSHKQDDDSASETHPAKFSDKQTYAHHTQCGYYLRNEAHSGMCAMCDTTSMTTIAATMEATAITSRNILCLIYTTSWC